MEGWTMMSVNSASLGPFSFVSSGAPIALNGDCHNSLGIIIARVSDLYVSIMFAVSVYP